ncbi:MAG: sulfotransferase [bacterium]|nr:sulfotransferase [bacterium]
MGAPSGQTPNFRLLPRLDEARRQETQSPDKPHLRLVTPDTLAPERRPILITGSHRSGSTWVGRTLAQVPEVAFINEPFHPCHRPGVCSARFVRWYQYITEENEAQWKRAFERTMVFDYAVAEEVKHLGSLRDAGRLVRDWTRFLGWRARSARPLLKDPIAFFSAPWLARTFECEVVVLVRHPAAFASSLKRLDWHFDFENWLAQPLLMRDWLHPWESEIHDFASEPRDVIDQAALMWNVIHGVAAMYHDKYPDWRFVRHEDLSLDPIDGFRDLYTSLNIEFTEDVERTLEHQTSSANPAEAPSGTTHALVRDSRANVSNWKQRLTSDEVRRLRAAVAEASAPWYDEAWW